MNGEINNVENISNTPVITDLKIPTSKIVRRRSIDVSKIEGTYEEIEDQHKTLLTPSIKISQYNSLTKLNSSVLSLNDPDLWFTWGSLHTLHMLTNNYIFYLQFFN